MHILILGGGVFLGAAILRTALERGHELTRLQPRPRAKRLARGRAGDRRRPLGRLSGRSPASASTRSIDTCGYAPADVKRSAEALRDVKTYCFVSSISAYASFRHPPIREIDPLADFSKIDPADRDLAHYGPQKAACEAEVQKVFGERAPDRSARPDRRPRRPQRPLQPLAVARARRRRDAGARPRRRRAAAVHRRARPRRLDRPPGRARRARRLQRHRAGERPAVLLERADRRLPGRGREARRAAGRAGAGGRGLPARPRRRAVERAAALAAFDGSREPRPFARRHPARRAHPADDPAAGADRRRGHGRGPAARGRPAPPRQARPRAREAELLALWHARPAEANAT